MYDAIIVGARVAGAPTAMLLARKGYRVLLVDRGKFPSDTVSTHAIHASGIARLARWGLLDRLAATGVPPIGRYTFDLGTVPLTGSPPPADGIPDAYNPRRFVLDNLLVEAAVGAGAELLAEAIDAGLSGRRRLEAALADYEQRRNLAARPMYELVCKFAALDQPPPPEMQQLFAALADNQAETDRFIGVVAGTVPVGEFFAPDNVRRIIGAASPVRAA